MNRLHVLGLGALMGGALAAHAAAQVTKVKGAYLLRVHYVKGAVIRDTMTNSVLMAPGASPISFSMPVTMRVLDVTGNRAKIEITMEAVRSGGRQLYPGARAVATVNSRNEASGAQAGLPGSSQLPERAVRPGDTWTGRTPISTGLGSNVLEGTYTFVGLRTTGGPPVAVIRYTLKGAATGSGTETLLVKDGTVYSNDANLRLSPGASGSGSSGGLGSGITVHSVLRRN